MMTDRIEAIRERHAVIERVLAEHPRADWSDRTYACGGCRARAEDEPVPDNETPDELRARWTRLQNLIHPGWSFATYNAHVAMHIVNALAPVAPDAEPTEWVWSLDDVVQEADGQVWARVIDSVYAWRSTTGHDQRDQDITELVTKYGGRVLLCKARGIGGAT